MHDESTHDHSAHDHPTDDQSAHDHSAHDHPAPTGNHVRYLINDDFTYMGKHVHIVLNEAGTVAKITIDGKEFEARLHTAGKPEDNYIRLWECEGAYIVTESPELMAKHIIEYWHQYT